MRADVAFIASIFAQFRPSCIERAPVLCQANDETAMAWEQGERAAKWTLVDAFATKLLIGNPAFSEEDAHVFRAACQFKK